jgi:hypothetical protein
MSEIWITLLLLSIVAAGLSWWLSLLDESQRRREEAAPSPGKVHARARQRRAIRRATRRPSGPS